MRTFSMYFALFRCMQIDQDRVGETTSMYANRPRPCMRNDLDVCESTCMRNDLYAKRPASDYVCLRLTTFTYVCLRLTTFIYL